MTDAKLVDIVIDSCYNERSRQELAETHAVDPLEIQSEQDGDNWYLIRKIVLEEIVRHRVNAVENPAAPPTAPAKRQTKSTG